MMHVRADATGHERRAFCNMRVKNVRVKRSLLSSLKHRDPSWSGCQWSIEAKDPTGRDWARIHGEWDSVPGEPRLSRSVCWHSLTPLTFSLTLYQNASLSHAPPAESPQPPQPAARSWSSCSTLWSDPIYVWPYAHKLLTFPGVSVLFPEINPESLIKEEQSEGCSVC